MIDDWTNASLKRVEMIIIVHSSAGSLSRWSNGVFSNEKWTRYLAADETGTPAGQQSGPRRYPVKTIRALYGVEEFKVID